MPVAYFQCRSRRLCRRSIQLDLRCTVMKRAYPKGTCSASLRCAVGRKSHWQQNHQILRQFFYTTSWRYPTSAVERMAERLLTNSTSCTPLSWANWLMLPFQ